MPLQDLPVSTSCRRPQRAATTVAFVEGSLSRLGVAVVLATVGLVALLGGAASTPAAPSAEPATAVALATAGGDFEMAGQAPVDAPALSTVSAVPCLFDAGCGGGGSLTIVTGLLALMLGVAIAASFAWLPPGTPWLGRPSPSSSRRAVELLLAHTDGHPPRLAA